MKLLGTPLKYPKGETKRAVPFREFKGTRGEILLTKRPLIHNYKFPYTSFIVS
jgi:hypothetical protein